MKKLIVIIGLLALVVGCTNETSARRVLESNGYTDISFTGYQWFSCSKDDTYHTGFRAKSVVGKEVEGCVCEGLLFKNSTIRFK